VEDRGDVQGDQDGDAVVEAGVPQQAGQDTGALPDMLHLAGPGTAAGAAARLEILCQVDTAVAFPVQRRAAGELEHLPGRIL